LTNIIADVLFPDNRRHHYFDYKTEKFTNYIVPTPPSKLVSIYVTSDDAVWFCEFLANKIGRLNATDGTFKEYPGRSLLFQILPRSRFPSKIPLTAKETSGS